MKDRPLGMNAVVTKSSSQRPVERSLKLPFRESQDYRAIPVDSFVVLTKADEVTATIQLTFTRTEAGITAERQKLLVENGMQRPIAPPEYDQSPLKIVECSVHMRPDHIFQMATTLLATLAQLPEHIRLQYRIPQIETASVSA